MYKSDIEPLILNWNRLAMENLKDNKFQEAYNLLQKAEDLLKHPENSSYNKLLSITNNNLGCYYKKIQKFQTSLDYLFKALNLEIQTIYDKTNIAGTHLNICAAYSLLNQHGKALSHGIMATKLLKEAHEIDKSSSTLTSLIIALNSTGFEYELLKEYDNALITYKCGLDLAEKNLGYEHSVTGALVKAYKNIVNLKPEKTMDVRIFTKKRGSAGLPKIKTFSKRNKSVETNKKFFLNGEDGRYKEKRANSNKNFDEKNRVKRRLPKIDKPLTVPKRARQIFEDKKIHGLEEKIAELQNQIEVFQIKCRKLEERVVKPKIDKTAAAVKIQRFWREKHIKNLPYRKKSIPAEAKAIMAIKEFEELKMQHLKEFPSSAQEKKSPGLFKFKEKHTIPLTTSRFERNNRFYKTIELPLDPILESTIETKEMKAY
ncbi:hypothetical protein SteCoe_14175 [Stentor coeruleus]|uniref:Uncharacterized protein n=1 Tax=Stentor coeruleus TaxID=5963 RepID=A0A1R2C6L9_9CILI|nr:hypothetical protein SteCoe_14175 [Stentor coeruleus]